MTIDARGPRGSRPGAAQLPGYVMPGDAASPDRATGPLAIATGALLALVGVSMVLSVVVLARLASLADRDRLGGRASAQLADAETFATAVDVVTFVLYVAAAVIFLVWTSATVRNARTLDPMRAPRNLAVLCWFIPLFNFAVGPATLAQADRFSSPTKRRGWLLVLIWCWAAAFAAGSLLFIYARTTNASAIMQGNRASYAWATGLEARSRATLIVAAVLAIVVVFRVTARQTAALATRAREALVLRKDPTSAGL
jgi:hypothetical protein